MENAAPLLVQLHGGCVRKKRGESLVILRSKELLELILGIGRNRRLIPKNMKEDRGLVPF
jgi:hypothetical protein